MNIKIEQTLHGYETGHQLLMSSTPLSNDAKQTLLVQSDLSGSNIDENFKTYITGYPLNKYYAFSKTWYADEMRRPGCVWTQTFLIAFADLGKIPDLGILNKYFKRPIKDQYEEYSFPILIDRDKLDNSSSNRIIPSEMMTKLLSAVYNFPEKTILLPAISPSQFEDIIVQLWSNQWPRLRRNFLFCTGALSLKSLSGKEFDVQVIPRRNLLSVENKSSKPHTINFDLASAIKERWIDILYTNSYAPLHRFLWLYGSDVDGLRKNYRPLILLFGESIRKEVDFKVVNEMIYRNFHAPEEAGRLKNEILNFNSVFRFSRRGILSNLIASKFDPEIWQKINVTTILLDAYNAKEISLNELVAFFLEAPENIVPISVFDNIELDDEQLFALISYDDRFIYKFVKRLITLGEEEDTWKRSLDFQYKIIIYLEKSHGVSWGNVLSAILKSESEIIFDALKRDFGRISFALQWIDKYGYNRNAVFSNRIFKDYRREFIEFVRRFGDELSGITFEKLFQNLNSTEINTVGFDAAKWLACYAKINAEHTKIIASCVLLSFGFNLKVGNPAGLVVGCFSDVYYFAKAAKVSGGNWAILPIDITEEEEEERDLLTAFFSFLTLFPRPKKDIPNWDYCELLIRTLVNKFIKYGWPNQAFISTLVTEHLTQKAIRYCLSFKKGTKFLKGVLSDIERKKIKIRPHQTNFISQIIAGLS